MIPLEKASYELASRRNVTCGYWIIRSSDNNLLSASCNKTTPEQAALPRISPCSNEHMGSETDKIDHPLDVANLVLELLQLLLKGSVLLGHLLVLLLPLVTLVLEGLHLSLEVSGLDVGLSEPRKLCS